MTRNQKIRAMIESGLADDREDAIAQLVDMGEIEDPGNYDPGDRFIQER